MKKGSHLLLFLLPLVPWFFFPLFNHLFFHLNFEQSFQIFYTYLLFLLIGLLFFPLMSRLFPQHPDRAYGASKIFGLVLLGVVLWNTSFLLHIPLLRWNIGIVLILFAVVFFALRPNKDFFKNYSKDIIIVEIIFSFLFLFFLIQASFHPEAYAGEKSMDFSMLAYFTRLEYLPPDDPWAHGSLLRYYYFAYFLFAQFLKQTNMPPQLGYLVIMATLPALMAAGCYSLILSVVKKRWIAVWGALTLVLACNWQSLVNLYSEKVLNYHYFWSASRIFKNGLFAEFPAWSFTFLDLHPHVMAYPFVILALLFIWKLFESHFRPPFLFCLAAALPIGFLIVANLWDYFMTGMILFFVTILNLKKRILSSVLIILFSVIIFLPLIVTIFSGHETGTIFTFERDTFNGLSQFGAHQGQWWPFIIWALLAVLTSFVLNKKRPKMEFGLKSFLLICASSLLLMLFSNHIILIDKINSLFKINTEVWVFMGLGSFFLLRRFGSWKPLWRTTFYLPLVLFSILLFVGTIYNIIAVTSYSHPTWNRPILSATNFLERESPIWSALISEVNAKIDGPIALLTPYGKTYDFDGNKLSIFTGLPTYLVWAGQHVNQKGLSWEKIEERKNEIDNLYQKMMTSNFCSFLKDKKISLVLWTSGDLDRPCLNLWYHHNNIRIYQKVEQL